MATKIKRPLKWLFPSTISKEYQRLLLRVVRDWEDEAKKIIIPRLESIVSSANITKNPIASDIISDSINNDDWVDDIKIMMTTFASRIKNLIPRPQILSNIANKVSIFNNKQWKKIVKNSLGIDYVNQETWLNTHIKAFVEENTTLITKLQQETIDDITGIVTRGIQQGKRHETIATEILNGTQLEKGRFKKTRNRARLIARDQVNKLNGQLQQLRQTDIGVTRYIWRTSQDERVRTSHRNMDGRTCVWHNSSVYIGSDEKQHPRSGINGVEAHPGQPIQCRCNASPDFTSIKDLELIV
jgi:SPP1 gp7 family putative phage head morphogenesis protein